MKVIGNLKFLSLDELSSFLGLSKVTLRSYIKSGKLDGRKIGQRWFITEQSVNRLIKGSETENFDLNMASKSETTANSSSTANVTSKLQPDFNTPIAASSPQSSFDFITFLTHKTNIVPSATNEDDLVCEVWLDPRGMITYYSPTIELTTEYSSEEIFKNPNIILEIIHPADRDWVSKAFAEAILHKKSSELYYRVVSKFGKIHWIKHQSKPVFLPDGRYLGRQVLLRNVTDEKIAETTLSELWPQLDFNSIFNAPMLFFNEARTILKMFNFSPMLSNIIFERLLQVGDIIDSKDKETHLPNIIKISKCLDYLEMQKKYNTKLIVAYNPRIEINCYAFRLDIPPATRHFVTVLI